MRQEHRAAAAGRAGQADVGRDQDRRHGGQRPGARRARHRDGVPELRALSAHDGVPQPGVRPAAAPNAARRGRDGGSARRPNCWRSSELLDRKPGQLSGGQRQRVAMGRALVRKPQAFLLDEPLSNLDAKLRNQVRGDLKRLHRELPVTSIYVTHDQVEAMTLGDRLCVMSDGEVQQIGTTDDIYNRPANTFVAAFMGSPPMNLLPGVVRDGSAARRRRGDHRGGHARRSGDGRRAARAPRRCTRPWPTAWCPRASTSSSRSAATPWSPPRRRRHPGDRAGAGGHGAGSGHAHRAVDAAGADLLLRRDDRRRATAVASASRSEVALISLLMRRVRAGVDGRAACAGSRPG